MTRTRRRNGVLGKLAVLLMGIAAIALIFDMYARAVFGMSLFAILSMIPWEYLPEIIFGLLVLVFLGLVDD